MKHVLTRFDGRAWRRALAEIRNVWEKDVARRLERKSKEGRRKMTTDLKGMSYGVERRRKGISGLDEALENKILVGLFCVLLIVFNFLLIANSSMMRKDMTAESRRLAELRTGAGVEYERLREIVAIQNSIMDDLGVRAGGAAAAKKQTPR